MSIYSIYDKKALSFGPLFTCENDDLAKRLVVITLGKDTLLSSAPSDFSLYHLGEYDPNNGTVSGISPVILVCEVLSLINVDKNSES